MRRVRIYPLLNVSLSVSPALATPWIFSDCAPSCAFCLSGRAVTQGAESQSIPAAISPDMHPPIASGATRCSLGAIEGEAVRAEDRRMAGSQRIRRRLLPVSPNSNSENGGKDEGTVHARHRLFGAVCPLGVEGWVGRSELASVEAVTSSRLSVEVANGRIQHQMIWARSGMMDGDAPRETRDPVCRTESKNDHLRGNGPQGCQREGERILIKHIETKWIGQFWGLVQGQSWARAAVTQPKIGDCRSLGLLGFGAHGERGCGAEAGAMGHPRDSQQPWFWLVGSGSTRGRGTTRLWGLVSSSTARFSRSTLNLLPAQSIHHHQPTFPSLARPFVSVILVPSVWFYP